MAKLPGKTAVALGKEKRARWDVHFAKAKCIRCATASRCTILEPKLEMSSS